MPNIYFEKECISVDDGVFPEFCSRYTEIAAGGGVIRNSEGKYLLILRHGIWDLPKGKQEPEESIEQCALREVEEETGLGNIRLGKLICITHHTYKVFGQSCLKHTWWYDMEYAGDDSAIPQEEEDIREVKWAGKEELQSLLTGTYPSLLEVFTAAGLL